MATRVDAFSKIVFAAMLAFIAYAVGRTVWSADVAAKSGDCMNNMKEISEAVFLYSQDWDQCFPPADKWEHVTSKFIAKGKIGEVFRCPSSSSSYGYAMNRNLGCFIFTRSPLSQPSEIILLFESDASVLDAFGDAQQLATNRHLDRPNFVFADGHAFAAPGKAITDFQWKRRR